MRDCNNVLVTGVMISLCGLSHEIATGATLCVATGSTPACPFTSINAAVNAAAAGDVVQVTAGTYHEDVVMGKPLSLTGDIGIADVFIDATGLANGVYVDGLDKPSLA